MAPPPPHSTKSNSNLLPASETKKIYKTKLCQMAIKKQQQNKRQNQHRNTCVTKDIEVEKTTKTTIPTETTFHSHPHLFYRPQTHSKSVTRLLNINESERMTGFFALLCCVLFCSAFWNCLKCEYPDVSVGMFAPKRTTVRIV